MANSDSNSDDKAATSTGPEQKQGQLLDIFGKEIVPDPDGSVIRREICRSGYAMDQRAYAPETLEAAVAGTRRLMLEDSFVMPFRPNHPEDSFFSSMEPQPSFGRIVNVELESEGKDQRVMGTISLNELGKRMTSTGIFPGVSWGLMATPSLKSGQVLPLAIEHVAALGADTAAYAALQRSLESTKESDMPVESEDDVKSLFGKFLDFVKVSGKSKLEGPDMKTKNRGLSEDSLTKGAGLISTAADALSTAAAGLKALVNIEKEEPEEEKPEEEAPGDREVKSEVTEERQQDQESTEVREVADSPEMKEMRALIAENRQQAVAAQFRSLVESGNAAPDGMEAFLADVKAYDLDRAVDLAKRSKVAFPPQSGFTNSVNFTRDDATHNRELDDASAILNMDLDHLKVAVDTSTSVDTLAKALTKQLKAEDK